MPILNYSTTVDASKTVGEIQSILARAGATRIGVEYENAQPSGLMFQLHDRPYRLPANHAAIYELIRNNPKVTKRLRTEEQARRVAWRILKDWVEAQIAIIDTNMVTADQVFMPYQITDKGETLYELYLRADRLLPVVEED